MAEINISSTKNDVLLKTLGLFKSGIQPKIDGTNRWGGQARKAKGVVSRTILQGFRIVTFVRGVQVQVVAREIERQGSEW